jgi:hypothetical protein
VGAAEPQPVETSPGSASRSSEQHVHVIQGLGFVQRAPCVLALLQAGLQLSAKVSCEGSTARQTHVGALRQHTATPVVLPTPLTPPASPPSFASFWGDELGLPTTALLLSCCPPPRSWTRHTLRWLAAWDACGITNHDDSDAAGAGWRRVSEAVLRAATVAVKSAEAATLLDREQPAGGAVLTTSHLDVTSVAAGQPARAGPPSPAQKPTRAPADVAMLALGGSHPAATLLLAPRLAAAWLAAGKAGAADLAAHRALLLGMQAASTRYALHVLAGHATGAAHARSSVGLAQHAEHEQPTYGNGGMAQTSTSHSASNKVEDQTLASDSMWQDVHGAGVLSRSYLRTGSPAMVEAAPLGLGTYWGARAADILVAWAATTAHMALLPQPRPLAGAKVGRGAGAGRRILNTARSNACGLPIVLVEFTLIDCLDCVSLDRCISFSCCAAGPGSRCLLFDEPWV